MATSTRTITKDSGTVSVTARILDPNTTDTHTYDWSLTDNVLLTGTPTSRSLSFDPVNLAEETYHIEVIVTDSGSPALSTQSGVDIRVMTTQPILSGTVDTDGDGIMDASEGFGDSNYNGIPDYLDPFNSAIQLLTKRNSNPAYLETDATALTLGATAMSAGKYEGNITQNDLSMAKVNMDNHTYTAGLFDFEITLDRNGKQARVVIPQSSPIPDSALYRKLTSNGWQNFTTDALNSLASAPLDSATGRCPPPGDTRYKNGLTKGDNCVQLTLEDGGPNDVDGLQNGHISDPGGVTTSTITTDSANSAQTVTPAGSSSSGGGGSPQPWGLFGLLMILTQRTLRRLQQ